MTICGYKGYDQIVCCPLIGNLCYSSGNEGRCSLKKDCPVDAENKKSLEKCDNRLDDIICCPLASHSRNYNRRAVAGRSLHSKYLVSLNMNRLPEIVIVNVIKIPIIRGRVR